MIKYSQHYSKRTFTYLFYDFIPIVNMIIVTDVVLLLLSIEPIVCLVVETTPFRTS